MMRFAHILIAIFLFYGCKGKSQNPEADTSVVDSIDKVDTLKGPNPIILDGFYRGKNIYVQNPFNCNGTGFCVTDCIVNGSISTRIIESSAFEIDLKNYGLKIGDPVHIEIRHYDCCKPKVLNPEVIK